MPALAEVPLVAGRTAERGTIRAHGAVEGRRFHQRLTGIPAPESAITPRGLDRAALEAASAAFAPGVEAGGMYSSSKLLHAANYEAFRLNHAVVEPGCHVGPDVAWQQDFYMCGSHWWPVPRPNFVTRGGVARPGVDQWSRRQPAGTWSTNGTSWGCRSPGFAACRNRPVRHREHRCSRRC